MGFEKGNTFGKGRPKGSKNKKQNHTLINAQKYKGKSVVYVMGLSGFNGNSSFFKIGKTTNLSRRIKSLSSRLPFDVKLHHAIVVDSLSLNFAEKKLHKVFEKSNIRLEWFDLSKDKLDLISNLNNIKDIEQLKIP